MKQRNSIVIFVLGVFFINFVEAQIVHSSYFPVLAEDLNRWESYADFLVTSQLDQPQWKEMNILLNVGFRK